MRDHPLADYKRQIQVGVSAALLLAVFAAGLKASQSRTTLTIQGKLVSTPATGPVLHTQKKEYRLTSKEAYLLHTLHDKRLVGRELHLEGTPNADGTFDVEKLYAVHNGKLYRVRYYCEVCNIEALEPGDCVCCQQPTELQETPANENPSGH